MDIYIDIGSRYTGTPYVNWAPFTVRWATPFDTWNTGFSGCSCIKKKGSAHITVGGCPDNVGVARITPHDKYIFFFFFREFNFHKCSILRKLRHHCK